MVFIFSIVALGIMAWMLWVSADAYMRASETLRRYEEKEATPPPLKFDDTAKGPYAYFADELHPRKFKTGPRF